MTDFTFQTPSQVIDFAKSLEIRHASVDNDDAGREVAEENARWDALLETKDSQKLLEKMADEAWKEIQAGHAEQMAFSDNGQIVRSDRYDGTNMDF